MGIFLDVIISVIILISVLTSIKKGFVRTLIETIGFIVAIIIALWVSSPLAAATYNATVEPPIVASVEKTSQNSADDAINKIWENLPEFITDNAQNLKITKDSLSNAFTENSSQGITNAATAASQTIIKPVFVKIVGMIYASIIFILLLIVVRILAKLVNGLFSFSLVGVLNKVLGGALGFVKGVLFSILFCMIITLIASLTNGGFLFVSQPAIYSSYMFKSLLSLLPFTL